MIKKPNTSVNKSNKTKKEMYDKQIPIDSKQSSNPNQSIIDQYVSFVEKEQNSLPKTDVFEQIDIIYPSIQRETFDEIDNDKQNSLFTLFNTPPNIREYLQDPSRTSLNVILQNSNESNLYYFLTNVLYFNKRDVFESGKLNISQIKDQLGKDLHRAGTITINDIIVPHSELLKFQEKGQDDKEIDYFNLKLMDSMNKQQIPISLNTINLIDLCCIQQNIQFVSDMFLYPLAIKLIMQQGGKKSLNIILTSAEQSVEFEIESNLINIHDFPPPLWGLFNGSLKIS